MLALSIATLLGRRPPAEVPAGFSPASLFAASEVGVWYDPSDFSTLFQNTNGTSPVTAVEQPVGKMLDKSGNGFHATAANNGTARPVLRARYNQLFYSEQFDDAGWTKQNSSISANTADTTDPLGGNTADKYTNTSASDWLNTASSITITPGQNYTISVYAKRGTQDWFRIGAWLSLNGSLQAFNAWFDLASGQVGTLSSGADGTSVSHSIQNIGNGWYRCVVTGRSTSTTTLYPSFSMVTADNSTTRPATGNEVYLWGAQVVATNRFPQNTYQRIAAATDYDTDAAKFPPYLAFTTDDAMSTASIDFTGTDEMSVFAGVTKNSDAAAGILVELSADTSSAANNGSFFLTAPNDVTYEFGSLSRGTTSISYTQNTRINNAAYAAPFTCVATSLHDISGDLTTTRISGTVAGTATGDKGAGNFGNYPLYIGSRANSSLFFNGSLYSLIVRNKTSTATEITNTEAWVANKTGVTL